MYSLHWLEAIELLTLNVNDWILCYLLSVFELWFRALFLWVGNNVVLLIWFWVTLYRGFFFWSWECIINNQQCCFIKKLIIRLYVNILSALSLLNFIILFFTSIWYDMQLNNCPVLFISVFQVHDIMFLIYVDFHTRFCPLKICGTVVLIFVLIFIYIAISSILYRERLPRELLSE